MIHTRKTILNLIACVALTGVLTAAHAQQTDGAFTPKLGQSGKDVIWLPTHDEVVSTMLRMAAVTSRDYVVDLGSGDGKILIAAARDPGARGLGLEYNPEMVELSIRRAREAGVQDKVDFRRADIFASDFSSATVVTMYLLPELNLKLRPTLFRMKPGTRIVSNSFDMGEWKPDEAAFLGTSRAMLWIIPAHVAGTWTLHHPNGTTHAPQTLNLRQRFQQLEGDVVFDQQLRYSLQNVRIKGSDIDFETRDPQGQTLHFKGRVDADRLSGEFTHARNGRSRVDARRANAPAAFDEARATDKEMAEAIRALGAQ
ncbi:MAG: class I SAM-dependent methyltransferase [Pseudomonadota bacterium]